MYSLVVPTRIARRGELKSHLCTLGNLCLRYPQVIQDISYCPQFSYAAMIATRSRYIPYAAPKRNFE